MLANDEIISYHFTLTRTELDVRPWQMVHSLPTFKNKYFMRGSSSILQAIHHINLAKLHYHSFINEHNSQLPMYKTCEAHLNKIEWMNKSILTDPFMPKILRDAIRKEIESDLLLIDDVKEKLALVKPEIRETIDQIIDFALKDRDITVTVVLND